MIALARHVTRDLARPLAARLGPELLALGMVLVQFWTVIPWERAHLAAAEPAAGALGVAIVLAGALSWGPSLRSMLVERRSLAPIWRHAALGPARSLLLAPTLLLASLPAWLPAVLWPNPGATLLWRAALAVLLGALAAGGTRGAIGATVVAAGAAAAEVGLRTIGLDAALLPLALAALTAAGPVHAASTVGRPLAAPRAASRSVRPLGPLSALVWRDALALARTAPSVGWTALLVAVPTGGLLLGLRVNGGLAADALGVALATAACAVAPLGGVALARVAEALGPGLYLRRWPPGAAARAATLLVVPLAVFLPSGAAMAAGAHTAGAGGVGGMGLAAACCGAGAVLLVTRPPFDHGRHLWWILGVVLLALLGGTAGRMVMAVATLGALVSAARRLGRA